MWRSQTVGGRSELNETKPIHSFSPSLTVTSGNSDRCHNRAPHFHPAQLTRHYYSLSYLDFFRVLLLKFVVLLLQLSVLGQKRVPELSREHELFFLPAQRRAHLASVSIRVEILLQVHSVRPKTNLLQPTHNAPINSLKWDVIVQKCSSGSVWKRSIVVVWGQMKLRAGRMEGKS